MITQDSDVWQQAASSAFGHIAYHTWATQARHERRFNVARLLDALSASKLASAERHFRQLGQVQTTVKNIDRALQTLEPKVMLDDRVTGTTPLALSLLQRAQRALAESRDLRADELGDIFVCSICGYVREGALVGACPECGTVPEGHRPFRVIEAMGTAGPHAIVSFLEHTEQALRKLVTGLDEDLMAQRLEQPGPALAEYLPLPSLKELIGHLVDIDAVFRERAWLLLETDRPELPPAHPPTLDRAVPYRNQPSEAILNAFHESRKQTLSLLRGLTSAAWHRKGHHELYGEIDLLHQGNWMISHERSHMIELSQLRHDLLLVAGQSAIAAVPSESVVIDASTTE